MTAYGRSWEKLLRERQRRRHLPEPSIPPGRACRCAEGSCACAAAISACFRMMARLFILLHDAHCNNSGCDGVAFRWRQLTDAAAALAIALHHERLQRAPLRPTNCHLSNQNHRQNAKAQSREQQRRHAATVHDARVYTWCTHARGRSLLHRPMITGHSVSQRIHPGGWSLWFFLIFHQLSRPLLDDPQIFLQCARRIVIDSSNTPPPAHASSPQAMRRRRGHC